MMIIEQTRTCACSDEDCRRNVQKTDITPEAARAMEETFSDWLAHNGGLIDCGLSGDLVGLMLAKGR